MGRYEAFAAQNKRNRGTNDVQIDISIGSGDMVGEKGGKEKEYVELRAKVTNSILVRMRDLLNSCRSELEFFSRLDDEGISLMYLIALGITTEENVSSYQTMRERGIDTYKKSSNVDGKRIDSAYLREITASEKEVPDLLNAKGANIQKTLVSIKDRLPEVKAKILPLEEVKEPEPLKTPDRVDVMALANEVDLEEEFASFEPEEKPAEKVYSDKEQSDWRDVLANIKNNTEMANQGIIPNEPEPESEIQGDKLRTVYILSDEFVVPHAEGYHTVFIKDVNNLGSFTSNKNNLLVLTQGIPKFVMTDFLMWLKGLMGSGDKYRITTLKNSRVTHSVVQGELFDLTKESLDKFYETHENDDYIGDGVGSFYDLSSKPDEEELY